jgi:hypothetical protein
VVDLAIEALGILNALEVAFGIASRRAIVVGDDAPILSELITIAAGETKSRRPEEEQDNDSEEEQRLSLHRGSPLSGHRAVECR